MTKRLGPCGIRPRVYGKFMFWLGKPSNFKDYFFFVKMAFINLGFRSGVRTNLIL